MFNTFTFQYKRRTFTIKFIFKVLFALFFMPGPEDDRIFFCRKLSIVLKNFLLESEPVKV